MTKAKRIREMGKLFKWNKYIFVRNYGIILLVSTYIDYICKPFILNSVFW